MDVLIEFPLADSDLDAVRDETSCSDAGRLTRPAKRGAASGSGSSEPRPRSSISTGTGYIDDETLHPEMTAVRRQLAAMPASDDKVVVFDD